MMGKSNSAIIACYEKVDAAKTVDYIIGGGGISQIIVCGLGPSLSSQGVTGVLADPMIQLAEADGNIIDANDNWGDNPNSRTISPTLHS